MPDEDRTLPYGCGDIIVIGYIHNSEEHFEPNPSDVFGHEWIDADIEVRKVVRGPLLPARIRIRYFAHVKMREKPEQMLVLRKAASGLYEIEAGQRMAVKPRPAARCD